jgi:hypothetical protein
MHIVFGWHLLCESCIEFVPAVCGGQVRCHRELRRLLSVCEGHLLDGGRRDIEYVHGMRAAYAVLPWCYCMLYGAYRPADEAAHRSTDKAALKSTDEHANATHRPADGPADKATHRPTNQTAHRPAYEAAHRSTDKAALKSTDEHANATHRSTNSAANRATHRKSDPSSG